MDWEDPSGTITGNMRTGGSTAAAISDPRMTLKNDSTHKAIYKVSRYDETANTVTGAHRPNNGAIVIPDPRLNSCEGKHPAVYRVVKFDEPGPCVTGTRFGSGAPAIADTRVKNGNGYFNHSYSVANWDQTAGTVTSGHSPSCGAKTIADPRFTCSMYPDSYGIQAWDESGVTVRGNMRVMASRASISDPRLNCSPRSGTMGVNNWNEPSKTVIGLSDVHAGTSAVADPRIPADTEAGVYIIIAEDGTWHRPLTTLELAALQSIPLTMPDGSPLVLAGKSDARWREAIGNAVPPAAAKAMGNQVLQAWLAAKFEYEFTLSQQEIWVKGGFEDVNDNRDIRVQALRTEA